VLQAILKFSGALANVSGSGDYAGRLIWQQTLEDEPMRNRFISYAVVATAVVAVFSLWLISMPAAQNKPPAVKPEDMPTPRLANGHPDLTGFWGGNGENFFTEQKNDGDVANVHFINRTKEGSIFYDYAGAVGGVGQEQDEIDNAGPPVNQASYKPEYDAKVKKIATTMYGGTTALDPQHDCKPNGIRRSGLGGGNHPTFIVSSPQAISIMYEAAPGPYYRIVYTDGRNHPKDLDTSYMGHSIGHWDGDTLVVDTVGLNDETWLGGGKFTTIHSDKEHVIERITRKGNQLTYQATVEDPIMLTKPWVTRASKFTLSPNDPDRFYMQPQMCVNNDKAHLIQETATDKFKCGWCQQDADAVYGQGAAAAKAKADAEAKQGRRVGGGGE